MRGGLQSNLINKLRQSLNAHVFDDFSKEVSP